MSWRRRALRIALAASVAASVAGTPPALARGGVYGGTTTDREAIVVRTDAKGKKLKSLVIAWTADCKGGSMWSSSAVLTAAKAEPGFSPSRTELAVTRNARGRFAGTQVEAGASGDMTVSTTTKVAGKMKGKRASGTLSGSARLVDAQGNMVDGCETGTVRWKATRAPGRIFGGSTSQQRPVVVRVDRAGHRVDDLVFGWESSCKPDGFIAIADSLTDFPIKARRFGDSFSQLYDLDDGSKRTYDYDVAGTVSGRAAKGSIRVQLSQTDAGGAQTYSCDTGSVAFNARTG